MDHTAHSLYSTYRNLQTCVNRFENEINLDKSDSVLHNGLNGKRIKIGLCGHYSAGKTTLLKRLFSGYAGAISSDPQTACLTVHRLDSFQGITIKFKEKFSVNPDEECNFVKFLDDNKLENYVHQVSDIGWESYQKEEVSPDYRVSDTKRFLESVNQYMYAIEKIYWCHKKANHDINALDFLEIYDLPGFGGQEAHEDVIKTIIQSEPFDILICLIDSSQGLPTEKDIETLNNLAPTLEKNNPELLFYWAYEQPIEDIDLDINFDEINKAINGKLTNHFFQIANLLDLTGDKDDTEIPQNVLLKQVLSVYFQRIGVEYLKSQNVFWDKEKEKVPKLQLQPILNRIDDESRKGEVSRKRAEKIFEEMLQLDFSIAKDSVFDKQNFKSLIEKIKKSKKSRTENLSLDGFEYKDEDIRTLDITNQKERICKTCQEIMDYICTTFTQKIDVNKLRPPYFPEKYRKEKDWILLLTRISHYRTLKNYESIGQFFLSGIGTEVYRDIKQNLNLINKIIKDKAIIVSRENPYLNLQSHVAEENVKDNYESFDSGVENDSALSVVAREDLEVLRNDEKHPVIDFRKELTDYVQSVAIEIKSDIDSVNDTVERISEGYNEVKQEVQNTDDLLSDMGM